MSSIFTVPELAIGVGLSEAASAAFEPKVEVPKQTAWAKNPQRVPDLGLIAELIAGGKVTMEDGQNMANRLGFSNGTMESLVWLAQNRLDASVMMRLWRRFGAFDASADSELSEMFDKTIAHDRLDWDYRKWVRRLKTAELIGLGDIAAAIVRGAVPAPSWVPVAPPATTDKVPRFPVTDIDPVKMAAALGFDEDMLRIMTARSGLSLAPILATQANFRGLLTDNDWLLAIAEGDLRTEWADTLRDAARQILTAGEYAELQLRGYYDRTTRLKHTAKHGMSEADSDLLYDVQGRGVNVHQVLIGERRGGVFEGPIDTIPKEYLFALQRGNLRPEVYNLAYAARETYPSYFVTRSLLQSRVITPERGRELFLGLGWPEDVALAAADFFGGATTAKADTHVAKAQSQLWTTLHRSYLSGESSEAEVGAALPRAGVAQASVADVLATWDEERTIIRKQLSPAQVKKAYAEAVLNPETGVAWTKDEATAALVARGYSTADATTFLEL